MLLSYDEPPPVMLTSAALAAGAIAKDATIAVAARMPAKERFIIFFSLGFRGFYHVERIQSLLS
jgi:hypothetical protein